MIFCYDPVMNVSRNPLPTLPAIQPTVADIRHSLRANPPSGSLRNPHPEKPVSDSVRATAKPSAVLIPIIDDDTPRMILTRRHPRIRFAGHICFPGGRQDAGDESFVETAIRETEEEIALSRSAVDVVGSLGEYCTQAGFLIHSFVAIVDRSAEMNANVEEVDEIFELPLAELFDMKNYSVTWHNSERGHIACEVDGVRIAGPTLSILLGLYEHLARS